MLPFRKILFPVDFSEHCRLTAPIVRKTAEQFGSELILLHVVDVLPLGESSLPAVTDWRDQRSILEQRLADFQQELFAGMKPTLMIEVGDPGTVVRDVIRHQGADLVMLPTRGQGVIRRFLLGSVTAKVPHDVDCAVWTDTPDVETAYPYRQVLCCLDLDSEESVAVLRAARSIAESYRAELSLLHVVETPAVAWEMDYAPYRDAMLDAADDKIRCLRQRTEIHSPYEIVAGNPSEEVSRVAKEQEADLIVTGRGHAQRRIGRMWSNLYAIIREAPCPVLSI
jgi:nucleotide-binding universal stress UspA family protein